MVTSHLVYSHFVYYLTIPIWKFSLIANILYIVVVFLGFSFFGSGVGWEERVHEGHVCIICFKIYFK